jgi:hypothetical protein
VVSATTHPARAAGPAARARLDPRPAADPGRHRRGRAAHQLGHPAGRAGPRPPGRQLCWANRGDDGALPIITLSAEWEQAFAEALVGPGEDKQLALAPSRLQDFIRGVREAFDRAAMAGDSAVLLTSPGVRPYVRSIIERFRGQTVVMSQNEIHPRARLRTVGMV